MSSIFQAEVTPAEFNLDTDEAEIQEAKKFLEDIGEDPSEYSRAQLRSMIERGF